MDREKQINDNELIEIANTIVETDFTYRGMCWQGDSFVKCHYNYPINCQSCLTAKSILDKGYRKINDNEIVLNKKDFEENFISIKALKCCETIEQVKFLLENSKLIEKEVENG